MKGLLLALMVASCIMAHGQGALRINEVMPLSAPSATDPLGKAPGWVELHNAGRDPINLHDLRLICGSMVHRFQQGPIVPANGRVVVLCRPGRRHEGQALSFNLPSTGGSLLLLDADGTTMLDVFTWRNLPPGTSQARMPDGAPSWGLDPSPTPGAMNPGAPRFVRRAPAAAMTQQADEHGRLLHFQPPVGHRVRYAWGGAPPDSAALLLDGDRLHVPAGSCVRYRLEANDALPGPEAAYAAIRYPHDIPVLQLTLDPAHLEDPETGINVHGNHDNHTRTGAAWERPALLGLDTAAVAPVGLRIAGSGSRVLQKRSFKLHARASLGSPAEGFLFRDGTRHREGMLRADASPHAFLRNALVERIVEHHGLALDMQPSEAVALYLNGRYWGLYRWMPPKNTERAMHLQGGVPVDLLAGPSLSPVSGSADHFLHARDALLRGAPADSLQQWIDLASLIDLACVDLWTGRGDHDLNVRCHRPRTPEGRWRWMLFDLDLWSLPEENSTERMCAGASYDAPFIPALLQHHELETRLLARITALMATALSPTNTVPLLETTYKEHAAELALDHRRWSLELNDPAPEESLSGMRQFLQQRNGHLLQHLGARTGRSLRYMVVDVPAADQGAVYLEGLVLRPGRHRIAVLEGVPLQFDAVAAEGHTLHGERGWPEQDDRVVIQPRGAVHLAPRFIPNIP